MGFEAECQFTKNFQAGSPVYPELVLEIAQGWEPHLIANSLKEMDADFLAIEVAIKIKDVGFDGDVMQVKGWADANVDHTLKPLSGGFYKGDIHPLCRDELLIRLGTQVCRRIAQGAPDAVAFNHDSFKGEGMPKHLPCLKHSALFDPFSKRAIVVIPGNIFHTFVICLRQRQG